MKTLLMALALVALSVSTPSQVSAFDVGFSIQHSIPNSGGTTIYRYRERREYGPRRYRCCRRQCEYECREYDPYNPRYRYSCPDPPYEIEEYRRIYPEPYRYEEPWERRYERRERRYERRYYRERYKGYPTGGHIIIRISKTSKRPALPDRYDAKLRAVAHYESKIRAVASYSKLVNFVKTEGRVNDTTAHSIVQSCLLTNDPLFYLSLTHTESRYDRKARSVVGAIGLGQIVPKYHRQELRKQGIIRHDNDLYSIPTNIRATEHVFTGMLARTDGNRQKALHRYLGTRSTSYVKKTLGVYSHLQSLTSI